MDWTIYLLIFVSLFYSTRGERTSNLHDEIEKSVDQIIKHHNHRFGGFSDRKNPILNAHIDLANLTWNYDEQEDWGGSCNGFRQSPIDLNRRASQTECYKNLLKSKKYNSSPAFLTLINKGYSFDISSTFESAPRPKIYGGPLNGSYVLDSLHFHWGCDGSRGSEHTIGGSSFPLEMHLVHYSAKYNSLAEAVASGDSEGLAVIGVFFKEWGGPSNLGITLLTIAIENAKSEGVQHSSLPLGYLEIDFGDNYYTYLGSLTTPPCFEYVRWIVLETPLRINKHEADIFRRVKVNGIPLKNTYRNTQPLNGRKLIYNKGKN